MKKEIIRLTESDLHRIIKESVNRILKENMIDINKPLVDKVKNRIMAYGGYLEVLDEDIEELQVYDGDFDGESHGIVSMNEKGVETDDGDFYTYEELSSEDLRMIIDYIEWKLNN